jgi:membrane dipeptidase
VIVDAHNDLLAELVHREGEERPFARYWRPELDAGGVGLQVCPIYAADDADDALRFGLAQAAAYHRLLAENPDVVQILSAADLERDGFKVMLSVEGVEPLAGDPQLAYAYWGLGARMFSLTWNHRNPFADGLGVEDDLGLSGLGQELVEILSGLGAMLDLSHASPRTFDDVLAAAPGAVVLVSHACCRAVYDTPRNLSDDQLRAIAARGGVVGMMALPLTVDPDEPTIERFIDHFDHAVDVMGIAHVGLGGDFIRQLARATNVTEISGGLFPPGMAPDAAIEGLEGPAGYPALVAALERRGYTGDRLHLILHANWLRVFGAALPRASERFARAS